MIDGRDCQVASIDGQAPMFELGRDPDVVAKANAAFIAASRTLVPDLIAEVERLTKERDALFVAAQAVDDADELSRFASMKVYAKPGETFENGETAMYLKRYVELLIAKVQP